MTRPTAQRLLEYLEQNQPASCTKIGSALDITRANAHYHINQLMGQGLVEQLPNTKANPSRGRPTHLYRLSKIPYPDTLMHLTGCLLAEFEAQSKNKKEKHRAMLSLARKLFPPIGQEEHHSLPRRLNNIISMLNERGYKASWETHRDGPLVTFRNCPYLSIIERYPMMCHVDTLIIQELLGNPYRIGNTSFMTETLKQSGDCHFSFKTQ